METAWSQAFPAGGFDEDRCQGAQVVLRHDNGTQFTSAAYRDAAAMLKITLLRTAFRHPDGNAFIERVSDPEGGMLLDHRARRPR